MGLPKKNLDERFPPAEFAADDNGTELKLLRLDAGMVIGIMLWLFIISLAYWGLRNGMLLAGS